MSRDHIPVKIRRSVLVEAGHRCAIPTCRSTTTEIAHIIPWATSHDNSFGNLIALCPNCHTRFDQKKEIDLHSIKIYKYNLGILNNRYGDLERRLFEILAATKEEVFILGAGGDILVANAVKDGLFEREDFEGLSVAIEVEENIRKKFPLQFVFRVTNTGRKFINNYMQGLELR